MTFKPNQFFFSNLLRPNIIVILKKIKLNPTKTPLFLVFFSFHFFFRLFSHPPVSSQSRPSFFCCLFLFYFFYLFFFSNSSVKKSHCKTKENTCISSTFTEQSKLLSVFTPNSIFWSGVSLWWNNFRCNNHRKSE